MVGCLGIVDSCNGACESSFLNCATTTSPDEFERCEDLLKNGNLSGCQIGCAPTLEMMKKSENPNVINLSQGKFGTQEGIATQTAQKPDCEFGPFNEVQQNKCTPKANEGPAEGDIKQCDTTTTTSPTKAPSSPPECSDSTDSFLAIKPGDNAWQKMKTCQGWVSRKSTAWRCYKVGGVKDACPKTCLNCCEDTPGTFELLGNGKTKTCIWASANTETRCRKPPTRQLCAVTCGLCPTPSPVASPVAPPSNCINDSNWVGKFNADHTCDFVALDPTIRCNWENSSGVSANDGCPAACNSECS